MGNDSIVDQFESLYEENFQGELQEPWENIKNRILDPSSNLEPKSYFKGVTWKDLKDYIQNATIKYDENRLLGGFVFEIYSVDSSEVTFGLVTYIAVDSDFQSNGIGEYLLMTALPELIKERRLDPKLVFCETEIPDPNGHEEDLTVKRLRFFKNKIKAKHIDINYLSPPLSNDGDYLDNLFLLVLPHVSDLDLGVLCKRSDILDFLNSFYKTLVDVNSEDAKTNLAKMEQELLVLDFLEDVDPFEANDLYDSYRENPQDQEIKSSQLDDILYLAEVPLYKYPNLQFNDISICYHIPFDHKYIDWEKLSCPIHHSFEQDLLSRSFQNTASKPIKSKCIENKTIILKFSNGPIKYVSEGRRERLFIKEKAKEIEFNCLVNYVYFKEGTDAIAEVILTTKDDNPLNEYQLIQLIKFFEGKHENSKSEIKYLKNRFNPVDLLPGGIEKSSESTILTGTVQIDLSTTSTINNKYFDFQKFLIELNNIDGNKGINDLNAKFDIEILKILCGLCTGILDFSRLEYEEILDTFQPLQVGLSNQSASFLGRSILLNYCFDDNLYKVSKGNIGMSPYLIIPNSILAYNQNILDSTFTEDKTMEDNVGDLIDRSKKGLGFWVKTILNDLFEHNISRKYKLETAINNLYIENIFQYPTEKEIYEEGVSKRNIHSVKEKMTRKIEVLNSQMNDIRSIQSDVFSSLITIIGLGFALLQIYEVIKDLLPQTVNKTSYTIYIICSILLIFILWYYRIKCKKIDLAKKILTYEK